jgi:hypothetical protein
LVRQCPPASSLLVLRPRATRQSAVWFATAALTGLLASAPTLHVSADDGWNPFAEKDRQEARKTERRRSAPPAGGAPRQPYLAPMTGLNQPRYGNAAPPQPYPATPPTYGSNTYQPPGSVPYGAPGTYVPAPPSTTPSFAANAPSVERGELTPVISTDDALPKGTWQGLDASGAEQLLRTAQLPPASPTLNSLFNRIMAEKLGDARLDAVRIAALLKAGRFAQAARLRGTANADRSTSDPVTAVLEAKLDLATGNTQPGCRRIKDVVAAQNKLPKHMRGEAVVLAGYCAIVAGNRQAGGLAAELARDAGYNRPFTLGLLEAIASGDKVRAPLPRRVSTIDGLLARQLKKPDPALIDGMLARADPGFLQLVATDNQAPAGLRLKAAERAAVSNITSPAVLIEAYRASADAAPTGGLGASGPGERARQFATAERNQAQFAKTRAIRALLDSAKRDGLYYVTAAAIAPIVRTMRPAQEISWFSETAVEALAAGADYQAARQWLDNSAQGSSGALNHWRMLLDIADPNVPGRDRGRSMAALENLALQGRFSPAVLHRLATVLDALDYNVPIPLWNLASRTEQPQTGHLPATGILSAMKQASVTRQIAATTLYAMRTIAPTGTSATHLLGLGETIRALKRAGLKKDARRLGFEALFIDWPRSGR